MARIRVLIVDDHPVVREGLRSMLAAISEVNVVGEASDASMALSLAEETRPDLILLDIRMPMVSGIELAARLHATHPEIGVIILSNYRDRELVRGAFQAEVRGYLLKTATLDELTEAIRRAARGERVLAPELLNDILAEYSGMARDYAVRTLGLNPDDVHLLRLLVNGLTNQQIARMEFISEATVKRRLHDLYRKLGASDRAHAIALALRHGIL